MPLTGTFTGIGIAPRVSSAAANAPDSIIVVFNESIDAVTGTVPGNYTLTPGGGSAARVVTAVIQVSAGSFRLMLDGDLTPGSSNYTLTVTNVEDAAGNIIDPAFDTAVLSGPSLVTDFAPKEGGGPFTILATGLAEGGYEVFLGPLGSDDDPQVYNGIPGSGGTILEFVETSVSGQVSAVGYLPPLPVGGPYNFTMVPEGGGGPILAGQAVTVVPSSFRSQTMMLRRILPPWYKTGVRNPDQERFPQ